MVRNVLFLFNGPVEDSIKDRLVSESKYCLFGTAVSGEPAMFCQLIRNIAIADLRKFVSPHCVMCVESHISFRSFIKAWFKDVEDSIGTLEDDRWNQCRIWPRPKTITERL